MIVKSISIEDFKRFLNSVTCSESDEMAHVLKLNRPRSAEPILFTDRIMTLTPNVLVKTFNSVKTKENYIESEMEVGCESIEAISFPIKEKLVYRIKKALCGENIGNKYVALYGNEAYYIDSVNRHDIQDINNAMGMIKRPLKPEEYAMYYNSDGILSPSFFKGKAPETVTFFEFIEMTKNFYTEKDGQFASGHGLVDVITNDTNKSKALSTSYSNNFKNNFLQNEILKPEAGI